MAEESADTTELDAIPTFVAEVVAVQQNAPRMKRITVGGDDLARFVPKGPDQFLYLLLPPPGREELTVGTDFNWTAYREMPEEERPVGAYYTVRHHRPERNEIDLDLVLHDVPSGVEGGHAARWAMRAKPGDPVALWGPRIAYEPSDSVTDIVVFADETGLPAAFCVAEALPEGRRARLVIEVDGPADHLPAPQRDGVQVIWLHRNGAVPGTTSLLEQAARDMAPPDPATTYVYGGAESRAMTSIRRIVRRDWNLPKESVSLVPYWRRTG